MISEAELRRWAGEWSTDPMLVDLDYVLGCFLSQWYQDRSGVRLRFKGGTCLRKCYFDDYRFSEDLDFTAESYISPKELQDLLTVTVIAVRDTFGINLHARPPRFEVVDDDYGFESYQVRLYYWGPLQRGGDPRAIRLDISHGEYLGLPEVKREIIHPYSDYPLIAGVIVPCYDLREMIAEKLRALSGQRRYAISRDLFDVHQLLNRAGLSLPEVKPLLARKFGAKNMSIDKLNPDHLRDRKDEFELDWERNLLHLIPAGDETSFDQAWGTCLDAFDYLNPVS
jgi:predicted nucleotidyltransferase component of viral defense system